MDFNPYQQWLQIETDARRNHYELLGLPLFSDDEALIEAAYAKRFALVRRYEVGTYSEHAIRVISELSAAFHCLTDRPRKLEYDTALREDIASRETRVEDAELLDTSSGQGGALKVFSDDELDPFQAAINDALRSATSAASEHRTRPPRPPTASEPPAPPVAPLTRKPRRASHQSNGSVALVGLMLVAVGVFAITWTVREQMLPHSSSEPEAVPIASAAELETETTATASVPWDGELARMLITNDGPAGSSVRLLMTTASRSFEATSSEDAIIRQLQDCICAAENESKASRITLRGEPIGQQKSFFTLGETAEQFQIESIEIAAGNDRETATEENRSARMSLRTIDGYSRFEAEVTKARVGSEKRLLIAIGARQYLVEMPAAWQSGESEFDVGRMVTFVARTTDQYEPIDDTGTTTRLLLMAETVDQPDFRAVDLSMASFIKQRLTYRAAVMQSRFREDVATVTLTLQYAGRPYSLHAFAPATLDKRIWLQDLDWREPMLAELEIVGDQDEPRYQLVSLTHLHTSNKTSFEAAPQAPSLAVLAPTKPVEDVLQAAGELFVALPDAIDLPAASAEAEVLMTFGRAPREDFDIELDSSLIDMSESRMVAKRSADDSLRWTVWLQSGATADRSGTEVGHFLLRDKDLMFEWTLAGRAAQMQQLRNCFATLTVDGELHAVALRKPKVAGEAALPPARDDYRIKFDVSDLPDGQSLRADVAVSYAGTIHGASGGPTLQLGRKLAFHLREADGVEVGVMLLKLTGRPLMLEAVPRFKGPRRTIKLDPREIVAEIAKLTQAKNKVRQKQRRAVNEHDVRGMRSNDESIRDMDAAIASLTELRESLAGTILAVTEVRYRVYADGASGKLLLVDGGFRDEDAVARDDPAGGQIEQMFETRFPGFSSPRRRPRGSAR